MVAAGSAFSYTLVGCAANEIDYLSLPCIAYAPIAPVAGMTYIRASQLGCALDCDLYSGLNKNTGGAATDDAPLINAALAGATATNPITLILDGSALISGLFLPAGGYWGIAGLGCGTGFFVKTGTNNDGIHNGNATANVPQDPGPYAPLPARGSNVSLSNFTLNGNQSDGVNGDSTNGDARGGHTWYFGISLMNLNNITITNVVVVNAPTYHIRMSNVGNVVVTGCLLRSSGPNTDGLHFDGPANDISISNCDFTTGDDAIALNCPEGYTGNISRVTVTNCTFNSFSLMRLYPAIYGYPPFQIDSVSVSGCSGTLLVAGFLIGTHAYGNPNAVLSLSVSNCKLAAPAVLDITADFSSIALSGVTLVPTGPQDIGYAFARSYFYASATPYAGGSLSFANCIIARSGNYPVTALMLQYASTIGVVEFDGFSVQDSGGLYAASPELLDIVAGSIGQVVLGAVNSAHITAAVSASSYSGVGSVSGVGVLATGWEFPDAVMANGTPYLSASSGKESIKVGGVVKPYP
jgi:Glycosyl hydrolases family 28